MIEKIKSPLDLKVGNYKGTEFDIIPADTFAMVCRKINELVDAVNVLHEEAESNARTRADHEHKIEELQKHEEQHLDLLTELNEIRLHQNKAPAETPTISKMENVNFGTGRRIDISYINDIDNDTDPCAEQRRWIGKLCWFWDNQEEYKFVGILWEIADNGTYFQKGGIVSYLNCEPVKPDDDIIYKGE